MDVPLPHLDRPFDYLVPADLADAAIPGCRVRVRFSGQLVGGFVLDRRAESEHEGRLSFLERVTSAEPVLRPEVVELARAVADRYAGTLADVLRLAVPPRHARVESGPRSRDKPEPAADAPAPRPVDAAAWADYPTGPAFLTALEQGRPPRAVLTVLPGEDWPARFADAAVTTLQSGRNVIAVVPDARDLDRLDATLHTRLGPGHHVALHAALGPAERYRRFLRASRGEVSVVIGTRPAAFAPARNLGLVAIWDDGDDLYAEPRSPYPHALQVLLIRAQLTGAGTLVAAVRPQCGGATAAGNRVGEGDRRFAGDRTAARARGGTHR